MTLYEQWYRVVYCTGEYCMFVELDWLLGFILPTIIVGRGSISEKSIFLPGISVNYAHYFL